MEEESTDKQIKTNSAGRREKSTFEKIMSSSVTNTVVRELTRGILGVFGISTTQRRRTSSRRRKR